MSTFYQLLLRYVVGCLSGLAVACLNHRSLPPVFESRRGHIWRLFHLLFRFVTFGGGPPCAGIIIIHIMLWFYIYIYIYIYIDFYFCPERFPLKLHWSVHYLRPKIYNWVKSENHVYKSLNCIRYLWIFNAFIFVYFYQLIAKWMSSAERQCLSY